MKPPPFSYHDPKTVAETIELLGRLENAKLLAGGQSLMPMLNMRFVLPDHIIDLNLVQGLSYIRENNGAIEIGAMTRQRDLEFSDVLRAHFPIMHEALLQVGHRQTRNRGTIGGSLANNDPAADYPAAVLALGATIMTNAREIAADDFFRGMFETVLAPGELITAVKFPLPVAAGYAKFQNAASRFALVGVFVAKFASGIRVAVTGAGPVVFRVPACAKGIGRQYRWLLTRYITN